MLVNTFNSLTTNFNPISSSPNKNVYLIKRFVGLFVNAGTVYLPVHLILFLIRFKRFRENPTKSAYMTLKGFTKSCLFAAFFAMSIPFSGVYFPQLTGRPVNSNMGFLISFSFAWFILFEGSSRWGEMSIWVLAQWFEAMIISAKKNKYYVEIPHLSVSRLFKIFWFNLFRK